MQVAVIFPIHLFLLLQTRLRGLGTFRSDYFCRIVAFIITLKLGLGFITQAYLFNPNPSQEIACRWLLFFQSIYYSCPKLGFELCMMRDSFKRMRISPTKSFLAEIEGLSDEIIFEGQSLLSSPSSSDWGLSRKHIYLNRIRARKQHLGGSYFSNPSIIPAPISASRLRDFQTRLFLQDSRFYHHSQARIGAYHASIFI